MHAVWHVVFHTPFLVFLLLWFASLMWLHELIEHRLEGRQVWFPRFTGASGSWVPWVLAQMLLFIGAFGAFGMFFIYVQQAAIRAGGLSLGNAAGFGIGMAATFFAWEGAGLILYARHNSKQPPLPPPAWFATPDGGGERYWDGKKWTDFYRGTPQQGVAVPPPMQWVRRSPHA